MIEISGKLLMVTTITGDTVLRKDCIQNKETGKYYQKNVSAFLVELEDGRQKWQRIDNGRVAFNWDRKEWDLIKRLEVSGLTKGIFEAGKPAGYFTMNDDTVLLKEKIGTSQGTPCINAKVATESGYIPSIWDDCFYNKRNLNRDDLEYLRTPQIVKYRNLDFRYNAAADNSSFLKIRGFYDKFQPAVPMRTQEVSKLLFGKSFGIEFETRGGTIPEKFLGKLGIVPLKDGSLRLPDGKEPYEYTTVPFYGAKGLETVKYICEELNKRCIFDDNCSLHVHLGNVKFDKLSIIAYYILIQNIQEELYSIFPQYKRDEVKYLNKPKAYNAPLPNIGLLTNSIYKKKYTSHHEFNAEVDSSFSKIIEYLTKGGTKEWPGWDSDRPTHPLGNTKWNLNRYFLVNINSLVFSSTRTIEFRLSSPTFNFTKVTNWLFICAAIITYAEKYSKEIISRKAKPTLKDILSELKTHFGYYEFEDVVGSEISSYLCDYVDYRKELIAKATKNGDVLANNIEFKADKDFRFQSRNMSTIY